MNKINIAIDGYAACGKSTIAKELAKRLGYVFIDSGAMYRAVTLYFIKFQVDAQDEKAVQNALEQIDINFKPNNEGYSDAYLNGQNVEQRIREKDIADSVSQISTIKAVRTFLVAKQQAISQQKGIVMDGRDIGTVVFPDAELKLFMTAQIDVRTQRRYDELQRKGIAQNKDTIAQNLVERDHIDSSRTESPLRQASDALVLDNSNLSPQQQLDIVYKWAIERIEQSNKQPNLTL